MYYGELENREWTYERFAPGNQDLGKCYQPRPLARLITLTSTLFFPDITKTSSNNFFYIRHSSESQARMVSKSKLLSICRLRRMSRT